MGAQISTQRIPSELILKVLAYTRHDDVLSVSRLNRHFNRLVASSATIQYRIALEENGLMEQEYPMPTTAKVEEVKPVQKMWEKCQFLASESCKELSDSTINASFHHYRRSFSQGLLILHRTRVLREVPNDSRLVHIFEVASKPVDPNPSACAVTKSTPTSSKMSHDRLAESIALSEPFTIEGNSSVIGFATERYKYDLITLCSMSGEDSGNDTYNYTITAELRSLSTGAPHTLAQEPALRIVDSFVAMEDTWIFDKLVASLEIVGSRILILVRCSVGIRGTPKVYDRLICVEWMLGRVLAHDLTSEGLWTDFAFISDDLFILANRFCETLDIIRLPQSETDVVGTSYDDPENEGVIPAFIKLFSLHLPERVGQYGFSVSGVTINSRPGPSDQYSEDHGRHYLRPPFLTSPEKALVHVDMIVTDVSARYGRRRCGFVVHRYSLLDLLSQYSDVVEDALPGPLSSFEETQEYVSCGDPVKGPNALEWEAWGPDITHWFDQDAHYDHPQKVTYGQRMFWVEGETDEFVMWDFDPRAIRRALNALPNEDQRDASTSMLPSDGSVMQPQVRVIHAGGIQPGRHFKQPLFSNLPCVERRCPFITECLDVPIHIDESIMLMERLDLFEDQDEFLGKISILSLRPSIGAATSNSKFEESHSE